MNRTLLPPAQPFIPPACVADIIDKSCVLNFMPMQYGNKMIDLSGHNNHGVITGATQMHPPGSAIIFDGLDDLISVPDKACLDITEAITIEAWIKPTDWGEESQGRIVDKGSSSAYSFYINGISGNNSLKFSSANEGVIQSSNNNAIELNKWQHVIITYDKANVKFYVNGVYCGGGVETASLGTNNYTLNIGNTSNGSRTFDGKMDEVRIYSRAITSTEAREHYEGKFTNETDLELHYTFYTQTGDTVYDLTANANNGTRTGATWTTVGRPKPTYVLPTLYFDGVDDKVTLNNLNLINNFTVSMWFKSKNTWDTKRLWLTSKDNDFQFSISSNEFQIRYESGGGVVAKRLELDVDSENWYNVVFTYGLNGGKGYINGVLKDSDIYIDDLDNSGNTLQIGYGDNATRFFQGLIPEVLVLNKAISAAQVKRLFEWRRSTYGI